MSFALQGMTTTRSLSFAPDIHIFQWHTRRAPPETHDQRSRLNPKHIRAPHFYRDMQALAQRMIKLRYKHGPRLRLVRLRVIYMQILDRHRHNAPMSDNVPEARGERRQRGQSVEHGEALPQIYGIRELFAAHDHNVRAASDARACLERVPKFAHGVVFTARGDVGVEHVDKVDLGWKAEASRKCGRLPLLRRLRGRALGAIVACLSKRCSDALGVWMGQL
jgi:hypothetical protein